MCRYVLTQRSGIWVRQGHLVLLCMWCMCRYVLTQRSGIWVRQGHLVLYVHGVCVGMYSHRGPGSGCGRVTRYSMYVVSSSFLPCWSFCSSTRLDTRFTICAIASNVVCPMFTANEKQRIKRAFLLHRYCCALLVGVVCPMSTVHKHTVNVLIRRSIWDETKMPRLKTTVC